MLKTKQKIKLARWLQQAVMGVRKLTGRNSLTQVKRHGINWSLDIKEGIDFSIWLLGSFEPETVKCYQRLVKSGDIVLDIGANIGAHTLPLASAAGPGGKVIAFEPTDYAFAKLERNTSLNPHIAGRIECKQLLLGDRDETPQVPTEEIYSSWPLKEESGLHHLHQGRLMTTSGAVAQTLDTAFLATGLPRIDCIKLDIDGAETAMLRGARKVLTRWHPVIIMELAPYVLTEKGTSLEELILLLDQYGYKIYDAASGKAITMNPEALHTLIPPGASMNVVARSSM